jgi:hypothetical protein
MNKISNRKLAIWLFVTAGGIWLIFIGTEKFLPYIWSMSGITFDWMFTAPGFLGGLILGILQWRLSRDLLKGAYSWMLITPLSIGISMFVALRILRIGHASIEAAWMIATPLMVLVTLPVLLFLYWHTYRTDQGQR